MSLIRRRGDGAELVILVFLGIFMLMSAIHSCGIEEGKLEYQRELVNRSLAHWESNPRTGATTLIIDGREELVNTESERFEQTLPY